MASVTITGIRQSTAAHGDPLVPRLLLGRALRALREEAGISRRDAAKMLGNTNSKVGRLELGRSGVSVRDVAALLTLYGVDDDERTTLLALAEQTTSRPWWYADGDIVPAWVRDYFTAEQAAKLVRTFEPQYVPGLLQEENYARALIRSRFPEEEAERRVELRMRRQRVLRRRPRPLNLWVVLDERALWRPIGGPATMRAQIKHIIEVCKRPNVTVQIAPGGICGRVEGGGPLTLVRFPQQGLQDMVYLERADTAVYPVRRAEVERHWHVFNTLVTEAAPPDRTARILAGILAHY
ncbi:helix-turn-helix protein [Actinomadura pelletieri DSM 43383]|uniref:Helix-turn-helix protein n=1 Tax=Actinomadura pelletieri DSM 43383 TaxID=1120940 RepID=A0A495QSX5_9ACTN|nr:helix-turn-helix transcriptional regulator [Actinomadura pelletieri]RKS76614.1 helix-turn-helix protein [Actinomadura pelletieri DSM 43383]